jgi:hypothetical protein
MAALAAGPSRPRLSAASPRAGLRACRVVRHLGIGRPYRASEGGASLVGPQRPIYAPDDWVRGIVSRRKWSG